MRTFSTAALNSMNSLTGNGETFLWLLHLSHPNITDIYVVNNNVNIPSNGQVYTAYAFEIIVADDTGDKSPEMQLRIDNVDRSLIDEVRQVPTPITVDAQLIMASDPDTIEMDFPEMTLRKVSYNATLITGTLVVDEVLNLRFPADIVNAREYPGVF